MTRFVIVGGGPAGLAVAIEARLAGAEAVVIERCGGPVDKACGEGLMPAGVARLARIGVVPPTWGSHPFVGIRYLDATGGRLVTSEARFPSGPGLGIRRTALSEALRARALELGVDIREKTEALSFRETAGRDGGPPGPGVEVQTSAGPIAGDWLIGADGLHSQVRKWAGIAAKTGPARRLGIRRHFTVAPWTDHVEVWWSDRAEAYVTPVGPERVGVAFLWTPGASRQKGDYETFLGLFPDLAAKLGPPETSIRGAGPFDVRVETQVKGNVLLTGDAAGYVDALTGEGVALALEEAQVLVALCLAGRAAEWPARWTALTRRHRWFTRGLLAMAARPWLRRQVVRALAWAPWAMGLAVRVGVGSAGAGRRVAGTGRKEISES